MIRSRLMLLALLLSFVAGPAAAEALPPAVTIAQLLKIVRERSPRFAAIRSRIELAQAEVVAAGVHPNPRLAYGHWQLSSRRNTMFEGHAQEEIMLEVPVLASGQLQAREATAGKRVEATAAGIEADYAALARDTWGLFLRLLAGHDRIAVYAETAKDLDRLRELVEGREESGSASSYDVLRINVEAKALENRRRQAINELAATTGDLGILLGFPDWRPEALGDLGSLGVEANLPKLWAAAQEKNPEIAVTHREAEAADAGLEQARRERWPVPSLLVGTDFTPKPYGQTPFAGVAMDLPVFDRGQGGMARAEAEKVQVQTERDLVAARTRVELERAMDQLQRRREARARFESEVLAHIPNLREMTEAAYRLGKGTLLELLDATRARTEIRLTEVDLMTAENEAELDVLKASGMLIETVERIGAASAAGVKPPEPQAR